MATDNGYIEVDFKKFDKAISEIENYIDQVKKNMAKAQGEIDVFMQSCEGLDLVNFKSQWDMSVGEGSKYSDFCKALESYLNFLKYVESQYKSVQSQAINTADSL